MGELGQLLRATREEKGITLEQVEGSTRIRPKYLAALEEEDYDELPTPGHVHGFLRNYALYLGLDLAEVEALYAKDQKAHRLFEPRIFHPKNISLTPKRSGLKADLILALVIITVVGVVGGWAFWQYGWPLIQSRNAQTPTLTPTEEVGQVVTPLSPTATGTSVPPTKTDVPATESPTLQPTPSPTEQPPEPTPTATLNSPTAVATPTPTSTPTLATATAADSVELKVKVTERTWLQVTVDGEEQAGELLQAGSEREWTAKSSIYLICGNAGGVEVTVNGEEQGTLGERAQVVEVTWTPEGRATPTPQPEGTSDELTTTPTPGQEGTPTPEPTATP